MSSTSREAWPTDKGAAAGVQLSATWRTRWCWMMPRAGPQCRTRGRRPARRPGARRRGGMGHDPVAASPETHCWTTPVRRITSLPTSRTLQVQRPAGADGELAPRSQGGGFRDPADVVTGRPVACINKAAKALARLAGEVTTVTADPSALTDITRRAGRCRCGRRSPGARRRLRGPSYGSPGRPRSS